VHLPLLPKKRSVLDRAEKTEGVWNCVCRVSDNLATVIDAESRNLMSSQGPKVDHLTVLPQDTVDLLKAKKLRIGIRGFRPANNLSLAIDEEGLTAIRVQRREGAQISDRAIPLKCVCDKRYHTVQAATDEEIAGWRGGSGGR